MLVKSGEIITEETAQKIDDVGVERVKIMSPLTCTSPYGIDAKSYGINPATNRVSCVSSPAARASSAVVPNLAARSMPT